MMAEARDAFSASLWASSIRCWASKPRETAALAASRVRENSSVAAMPNWRRAKSSSSEALRTCSSAARSCRLANVAISAAFATGALLGWVGVCAAVGTERRELRRTKYEISKNPTRIEGSKERPVPNKLKELEELEECEPVELVVEFLLEATWSMKATAPAAASEGVRGLLESFASATARASARTLDEIDPPLTHDPSFRVS